MFKKKLVLLAFWCPCLVEPPWVPGTDAADMHSGPKSEKLDAESQHKRLLQDKKKIAQTKNTFFFSLMEWHVVWVSSLDPYCDSLSVRALL